jgi:hypothetical protein
MQHPSTIGNARRAAIIRPRLEALLAGVTRETSLEQREEAPVR